LKYQREAGFNYIIINDKMCLTQLFFAPVLKANVDKATELKLLFSGRIGELLLVPILVLLILMSSVLFLAR